MVSISNKNLNYCQIFQNSLGKKKSVLKALVQILQIKLWNICKFGKSLNYALSKASWYPCFGTCYMMMLLPCTENLL